ncbi:uncharacterized protein LOC143627490 [Bidens hawaiensis]|uniref:uncharacterized protein LOC143627490 n=1 Tax=Bidens hawaiensis TaxID=980011 RepID=UPI00404B8140
MSSSTEDVQYLQIPLQHILLATNGFADQNLIGKGGYGNVYVGVSEKHGRIAIKRLVYRRGQGDHEFRTEIALLSKRKHDNIVSLLGFCDEDNEKILVYKYESNGSLDRHLDNQDLTWIQRLLICLHAAHGLKYLHDEVGRGERIYHRDVKSSNILLDESWNPKISDFGLSRVGPTSSNYSFVISNPCGTPGYVDPHYHINGYLTKKSDVYSFGVVLWEVLCGRLTFDSSYMDDRQFLTVLAQKHYGRKTLDQIIPSYLHEQMNTDSLDKFSNIAYQCLKNNADKRPTMQQVVEQLQEALENQLEARKPEDEEDTEKQAEPAVGYENEREESKDLPPPPLPQEIAFDVFMHCHECARQVRRCVKELEGVEDVVTDCETHMVVVKGEKADPLNILERIRKKTGRKVKLLSPVLNPTTEEAIKMEQEEPCKPEEKKDEEVMKPENSRKKVKEEANPAAGDEKKGEMLNDPPLPPPPQEFALKVSMHCNDCATRLQKYIEGFEGVDSVVTNRNTNMITVKGTKADPLKVLEKVQKKFNKKVELVSSVSKVRVEEPKKPDRKLPQCPKGLEGVENVLMECKTVVVGKTKATPLKFQETDKKKRHRKVELLPPVQKLPTEEPKKPEQEEYHNQEEKRDDLTIRDVYFFIFIIIIYFYY